MIRTAKRLEGISEYYFAAKLREIAAMKAAGLPVINLGIGSPDLPPAPEVTAELSRYASLPNAHGYQGYTGVPALRTAFADWYARYYGVTLDPEGEVLPLLGSKEGIMHIAMTFLEAGTEALIPNPGYPTYRAATLLAGATPREYALTEATDWMPDIQSLEQTDLRSVRLMWVNYPNMPTGTPATYTLFEQLVAFGKKHNILIVNDNPYSFILNDTPLSILSVEGTQGAVLELNSLSKAQNMAGWRVGMLAGNADLVREVLRFKSNMDSGMFLPVQMAAVKAMQLPHSWCAELNVEYAARQNLAKQILEAVGCEVQVGQQGLFLWGKISAEYKNAFTISDILLLECNVFLTPGGIFGSNGDRFLRISLCSPQMVLQESLERLELYIKNKP
jgi:LL-diaminopimelate aminotransferase